MSLTALLAARESSRTLNTEIYYEGTIVGTITIKLEFFTDEP